MPKSVEDVLRESGFTEDQIKAMDSRAISGFTTILTNAQTAEQAAAQAREQAENTMRAQKEMLDTQINPALDGWASEKANLEAQVAFYRTQNEQAKSGGFVPQDAPGYKPPVANPAGSFVAGQNPVPGSPQFITPEQAYKAMSHATYITNEHLRLFGAPPPDDLETLVKEASENHFSDLRAYANRKYNFDGKKKEIAEKAQKDHDDKIRQEAISARDKEWSEKVGSNPNVRGAESSQYTQLSKAVNAGQMKDPLSMSPQERHQATQSGIMTEMAQRETVQ
jgi:hypothetical protein